MIHPLIKKILRGYLGIHFALLLTWACGPGIIYAFPLAFLLFGGIQALLLWFFINRKTELSVFWRWSIYFFSAMELMYTAALFLFEAYIRHDLSLDCLRSFNDPEFCVFYYAKYPNLLYFAFAWIWPIVFVCIWGVVNLIKKGNLSTGKEGGYCDDSTALERKKLASSVNMINPVIKNILTIYLIIHFAIMIVVTWGPILWVYFPEFFVLYGGTQAVSIWRLLRAAHPISGFRLRSIYFFSLLEVVYTIAMLCWRLQYNVSFSKFRYLFSSEPNTYVLDYAIFPNLFFVSAALIWSVVHYVKNKHVNKDNGTGSA